jgi:hypothetical protein
LRVFEPRAASGTIRLCDATSTDICLQNAITNGSVLRPGKRNELRGFGCTAQSNVITCTALAGAGQGKGFLINASGATKLG